MLGGIKDSVLWKDASEQYEALSLRDKINLHSKLMYPHERKELTLEDKLDIMMKIDPEKLLNKLLTEREIEVLNFIEQGVTYEDICIELGYASKASIVQVMNRIKKKILEAL
jgi:DNA-binding NarL/FixJ family response regulator